MEPTEPTDPTATYPPIVQSLLDLVGKGAPELAGLIVHGSARILEKNPERGAPYNGRDASEIIAIALVDAMIAAEQLRMELDDFSRQVMPGPRQEDMPGNAPRTSPAREQGLLSATSEILALDSLLVLAAGHAIALNHAVWKCQASPPSTWALSDRNFVRKKPRKGP